MPNFRSLYLIFSLTVEVILTVKSSLRTLGTDVIFLSSNEAETSDKFCLHRRFAISSKEQVDNVCLLIPV